MITAPTGQVHAKLERWKSHLLDLTFRNRLLAFRETAKTVQFHDLNLANLEDRLVLGRTITIEERAPDQAIEWPAMGSHLTLYGTAKKPVERVLKVLRSDTRETFEENGEATLFLGLAMLHWYEREDSEQLRRAPLIMVPVSLIEHNKIAIAEGQTRVNVTLLKKISDDFKINTDSLNVLPTDDAGLDVDRIIELFQEMITPFERWSIQHTAVLGQFTFTKALMWSDLEASSDLILASPVVKHIFEGRGEHYPLEREFVEKADLDERMGKNIATVVSADPSQLQAIIGAIDGNTFVLQGPPGTGKSQTITNMVAALLHANKTVLFVSEKMAALQVVEKRLGKLGLGPYCLELHSHKATPKIVLQSLSESMERRNLSAPPNWSQKNAVLSDSRRRLNHVASALHKPTPFAMPYQGVVAQLIALKEVPLLEISCPKDLSLPWFHEREQALRAYQVQVETSDLQSSAFRSLTAPEWSPSYERRLFAKLKELQTHLQLLEGSLSDCAEVLQPREYELLTFEELSHLVTVGDLLVSSPAPAQPLIGTHQGLTDLTEQSADLLQTHQDSSNTVASVFTKQVYDTNLKGLKVAFETWTGAFFLLSWLMLWSPRRALQGEVKEGSSLPDNSALLDLIKAALSRQRTTKELSELAPQTTAAFGGEWRGLKTDVGRLKQCAEATLQFNTAATQAMKYQPLSKAQSIRAHWLNLFTKDHALIAPNTPKASTIQTLQAALSAVKVLQSETESLLPGSTQRLFTAHQLHQTVESYLSEERQFRDWCLLSDKQKELRALGLGTFVDHYNHSNANHSIKDLFLRAVYQSWWETHNQENPTLKAFSGRQHLKQIEAFQELDREVLHIGQKRVAAVVSSRIPHFNAPGKEMATLRHQLQLKSRFKPLRQLFQEIPNTFRKLKPCLLMSPLSIAKFLDPSAPPFDIVIFDEASQIPPWDAIGAIARGKQVIIVGDSKQLPPTSFFGKASQDEDLELDEDDRQDLDSILEEAIGAGIPEHRLRWHYRSQHEGLIAFSNLQYYKNKLHTFPCAQANEAHLGVHWLHVPDGYYDQGRSRTNEGEAKAVIQELRRVAQLPKERRPSVGVVTFSMAQQKLILDYIDKDKMENNTLQVLFDTEDPLFVKNLENVQGDERDYILFSICYGPDRNGVVRLNFGALNRVGGERRLNVAITRAKKKVLVISTLRPEQMDDKRLKSLGMKHLKTYLDFAKRGVDAIYEATALSGDEETDSPFEDEVLEVLTEAGWDVHCQVGVSGYRIDLGVVHPDKPGQYILGVECDGASYHSSAVARERDMLRQGVLEGLGWRFHRVWSTDWWYKRDQAKEALLQAVTNALQSSQTKDLSPQETNTNADQLKVSTPPAPFVDESVVALSATKTPSTERLASGDFTLAPLAPPPPTRQAVDEPVLSSTPALQVSPMETPLAPPPPTEPTFGVYPQASYAAPSEPTNIWHDPKFVALVRDFPSLEARAEARTLISALLATHAPIHVDHLLQILRTAYGFGRLSTRLKIAFTQVINQVATTDKWGSVWLKGPIKQWTSFRVPGDKRDLHDIPRQEIANAALAVLNQPNTPAGEEELMRGTIKMLGLSNSLTRKAKRVLLEAFECQEQLSQDPVG